MAVSIDALREVTILRGLKDSDLAGLAADLAERRVAAGDTVVGEGTGGVAFFFILEGETSVTVGGEEVATLPQRRVRRRAGPARSRRPAHRHGRGEDRRGAGGDVRVAVPSLRPRPARGGVDAAAAPGPAPARGAEPGQGLRRAAASWIPSPRSCWAGSRCCSSCCSCSGASIPARAPSSSTGAPRARPSSRSRTRSTTSTRCARRSTAAGAPAGEAELTEDDLRARVAEDQAETLRAARARPRRVRALMVGGGCRGLRLARTLVAEGHAVRAVTRTPARRARDRGRRLRVLDRRPRPHRDAALRAGQRHRPAVAARHRDGRPNVAALHGSRLRMMLDKATDTTVRARALRGRRDRRARGARGGRRRARARADAQRDPGRAAGGRSARRRRLGGRARARPSNTF